jgi:hypothetical protein
MQWNPEGILSLIATLVVGVVFVMMVNETISVARGTDPVTNHVRGAVRRYPRITYAIAVLIGMLLGHFFWP